MFKRHFCRAVGIDLGTANTLIYVDNQGIVLREPSVVAVDDETRVVLAVGEEARAMIGRTPQGIKATRPLRDGVIADFKYARLMLEKFIERVIGKQTFMKPDIAIGVPSGVTGVERRAVRDAAYNARAGQVYLPEEPMAAAIGAALPVTEPTGSMIVDIGGGTTEVAVISLSGIVVNESIRVAGDELNESIIQYMKKVHSLAIGERTAEEIKFRLGSAFKSGENDRYEVRGLNLINGLPRTVTISRGEVREALSEPLVSIVEAIKRTLERTPPELAADIFNRGIVLSGGGALLQGLDELITNETEVPVFVADDPLSCVAIGTGKMLFDPTYRRVLEQSASEN
ncbi:MAG: rod shape-determining protein [Candidatus Obscuribacterales bacterium]|nr:rod shape-determining protein [Candidatus Obscuribacterales bacterium]